MNKSSIDNACSRALSLFVIGLILTSCEPYPQVGSGTMKEVSSASCENSTLLFTDCPKKLPASEDVSEIVQLIVNAWSRGKSSAAGAPATLPRGKSRCGLAGNELSAKVGSRRAYAVDDRAASRSLSILGIVRQPFVNTLEINLQVPDLWQQEAMRLLRQGKDVVLHAPTGAGKT